MEEKSLVTIRPRHQPSAPSVRDVLMVGFRRWRLVVACFLGILAGAVFAALTAVPEYSAEMKILVKRERVDPIVTPEAVGSPKFAGDVTDEELNSEVELIKSSDLLEKVALANHLTGDAPNWISRISALPLFRPRPRKEQMGGQIETARAVQELRRNLRVEPLSKTHLIVVSYTSPDPQLSAQVLKSLAGSYLDKHIEVHRPAGVEEFFRNEADRYHQEWEQAKDQLAEFNQRKGVVSAAQQKGSALDKATEFGASENQAETSIRETEERIQALEKQQALIAPRQTTQIRTAESTTVGQLKTVLMELELKRLDLLAKFTPDYRPVQDLDRQIEQVNAGLEKAQSTPLHEETTDRDPTYQWVTAELTRNRSELASLRARAGALTKVVSSYATAARKLDEMDLTQQAAMLKMKTAQENYLLYLRKQEEARISEALDRQRIINVAIAEGATVPAVPSNPRRVTLVVGALLALVISCGIAFLFDFLDPTLRTPDEVQAFLGVPVVAAIPAQGGRDYLSHFMLLPEAAEDDGDETALPPP